MYLKIDSNTQDASSMALLSGRISFPSVKFDKFSFYSPAPVCIDAAEIPKDLPVDQINKIEYLEYVNDYPHFSKIMPGGLLRFNNIIPNEFLKKVGMAEGYFGELIVNKTVLDTILNLFNVRYVERDGYYLIIPYGIMDVIKLGPSQNMVDEAVKIGSDNINEMIKRGAENSNQAFYIFHDRMWININKDLVIALNNMEINKYYDFVEL